MDIMTLLIPVLSGTPEIKQKVEAIFGQPVDHVSKCISQMLDGIKQGPGLVDKEALKQQRFMQIYQSGLRMGFQDWQAEIAAADCAGYPIIDVANSFATNRGWDVTVDQIQQKHKQIMPRFMDIGKKIGLFKETQQKPKGIPPIQVKQQTKQPPWRSAANPGGAPGEHK